MMDKDPKQYLWLSQSPGMKILQEELEFGDLYERLKELHERDENRSEKLHQICERLLFIERIKLASTFNINSNDIGFVAYQLNRLTAYLALTCVDVAAGGKNNRGQNFRMFLADQLPTWLQDWLAENYLIVKGDKFPYLASEPEWFKLDTLERCRRIAEHLWETRNTYTHTVEYHPTLEHPRRGFWSVTINDQKYRFHSFYEGGDHDAICLRSVGLKEAHSESDIVRMALVVQLRAWLGLSSDSGTGKRFFDRASFRRLGFELLNELDGNLHALQTWFAEYLNLSAPTPARSLQQTTALEFAKLQKETHLGNARMVARLDSYIDHLGIVNAQISEFLQSTGQGHLTGWELSQNKWRLLDILIKLNETRWVMEGIHEIREELSQKLNSSFY